MSGTNGSTGANLVDTGTHHVSETDPGPSYTASLACVNNEGGSQVTVPVGANNGVVVNDDDIVVCAFTNTEQVAPATDEVGGTKTELFRGQSRTRAAIVAVRNTCGQRLRSSQVDAASPLVVRRASRPHPLFLL